MTTVSAWTDYHAQQAKMSCHCQVEVQTKWLVVQSPIIFANTAECFYNIYLVQSAFTLSHCSSLTLRYKEVVVLHTVFYLYKINCFRIHLLYPSLYHCSSPGHDIEVLLKINENPNKKQVCMD